MRVPLVHRFLLKKVIYFQRKEWNQRKPNFTKNAARRDLSPDTWVSSCRPGLARNQDMRMYGAQYIHMCKIR